MSNFEFTFDGEAVAGSAVADAERLIVTVGESTFDLLPVGENLFTTVIDGRKRYVAAVRHKGVYYVDIDSVLLEVGEPSEDGVGGGAGDVHGEKDKIFAPMPGKIVKILVEVGDEVIEKQPMVIVEAMKMENQVNAKAKGKVKAVNFAVGDQVNTESPIIELEIAEE